MKTSFYLLITSLLFMLFSAVINPVYAQTVSGAQCVICGGMNGNHTTTCKYYNPPANSNSGSTGYSMEQEIMGTIFQSFLKSVFSSSNSNDVKSAEETKKIEEEKQNRIKQLALKQSILKEYNDALAKAEYDKMMKDYKKLEGSGDLKYKSLDDEKKWSASVKFNCKITSFKGDVRILKSNGKIVQLSENQSVDLEPGDWIATGVKSNVKLHYLFEKGGEDLLIGQKSALTIVANAEGNYVPKLIDGNLYIVNNMVTEKIAEGNEAYNEAYDNVVGKTKSLMNLIKIRTQIRTPTAVCGIRGTEFTINVDSLGNTMVIVMKGLVDLTCSEKDSTITLSDGDKAFVYQGGEISGPLKYENIDIDNWWKE